jgi:hypothetical protein
VNTLRCTMKMLRCTMKMLRNTMNILMLDHEHADAGP